MTPAQLALAWVLAQGDGHRADPGHDHPRAPRGERRGGDLALTREDLARIDAVAPKGVAAGERYPAAMMERLNL